MLTFHFLNGGTRKMIEKEDFFLIHWYSIVATMLTDRLEANFGNQLFEMSHF